MKNKFITFILAITMFAPLISSFGISQSPEHVDATDYPADPETVYELGDTTKKKYAFPKGTPTYNSGVCTRTNKGEIVAWNVHAPTSGNYAFDFSFSAEFNTLIECSITLTPKDSTKETVGYTISGRTVKSWAKYTHFINHVSLEEGYYELSFSKTNSTIIDIGKPFEVSLDYADYIVKTYVDGVYTAAYQGFGTIGEYTNLQKSYLKSMEDEFNMTANGYYLQPFSQKEISLDDSDTIALNYYSGKANFPYIEFGKDLNKEIFTIVQNLDYSFYWIMPKEYDLVSANVISQYPCTLTVNGTDNVLSSGQPCIINLSNNPTILFTCPHLSISNAPVLLINSDLKLDSLCINLNKPMEKISDADSSAAQGSISIISCEDGTITPIDSDDDPSTYEITKFKKRGYSSYYHPYGKFSFNLKLNEKYPMVKDINGNDVKGKSWRLIANNSQEFTGLGNSIAQDLAQLTEDFDGLSYKFVNLYLNGQYYGVFFLVEKQAAQTEKRINIIDDTVSSSDPTKKIEDTKYKYATATTDNGCQYYYIKDSMSLSNKARTGMVVEKTYVMDSGVPYIKTSRGRKYEIKEPSYPSEEQMKNFATHFQKFEDALLSENGINSDGKDYSYYVDIDSISKHFLIEMMFDDLDFLINSTYLAIDVDDDGEFTKITSSCEWDFSCKPRDRTFLFDVQWDKSGYEDFIAFFNKGDFIAAMTSNYNLYFKNIIEKEISLLTKRIAEMKSSMKLNQILYDRDFETLSANYLNLYKNRIEQVDNVLSDKKSPYFCGVAISWENGQIKSHAKGATSYQWYKIDSDGQTSVKLSSTDSNYTPTESGRYYVIASGTPIPGYYSSKYPNAVSNKISIKLSSTTGLTDVLNNATSGDIVVLTQNYADVDAVYAIKSGVTLDLNGYTITNASNIVTNGKVVDTNPTKGSIEADSFMFGSEQEYLPIYDTTKGGYSFFNVTIEDQMSANSKLQFRMTYESEECAAALDLIGKDISGSRVKAKVTVSYKLDDGTGLTTDVDEEFEYNNNWMNYVIWGNGAEPTKTYKRVFNFTITNISELVISGKLKVQCGFVTYQGSNHIASVKGTKWKTADLGKTWVAD